MAHVRPIAISTQNLPQRSLASNSRGSFNLRIPLPCPHTTIFSLPHRNSLGPNKTLAGSGARDPVGCKSLACTRASRSYRLLAPDRAAGREGAICDDMRTVQRERRVDGARAECQDDQPESTPGPAQKRTVAVTPRHRREEEKSPSCLKSKKFVKTEKQQHHKSHTSSYSRRGPRSRWGSYWKVL